MRTFAVTILILGAACAPAASAVSETLGQHHAWARKFVPRSDPAVTGSIGLDADFAVRTQPPECAHSALRFDNLPFEPWRVERCGAESGDPHEEP